MSSTKLDFQATSKTTLKRKRVKVQRFALEARISVAQCWKRDERPKYATAANGSNDLSIPLKPVRENICPNLWPGLNRSGFGANASGANTSPPCIKLPPTDNAQA